MSRKRLPGGPCGFVVLDKPSGITSLQAAKAVGRKLGQMRVGHTGTLDPMATGVLPILLGEATKLAGHLLCEEKTYQAEIIFGSETDSLDRTGRTTRVVDASFLSAHQVAAGLEHFVGTIEQRVPAVSAIRVGGKRLYELARKGEVAEAQRPVRQVEIFSLELIAFVPATSAAPPRANLLVSASAGTYVRTLAEDLGRRLGSAAHLGGLRRTRAGRFGLDLAVTLDGITLHQVRPPEAALPHVEQVLLPDWAALRMQNGGFVESAMLGMVPAEAARACLLFEGAQADPSSAAAAPLVPNAAASARGRLLGLGRVTPDGWVRPLRLLLDG